MAEKKTTKKTPGKRAPAKKPVKKPVKETQSSRKKTIAQRQTLWKSGKVGFILRWLAMGPLGALWYIFTYLMAGYSFTALVCLCLIGILLFYNLCYLAMPRYPKMTRVVKSLFTFLLCIGILVVGVTEILIIHASFGDRDETHCDVRLISLFYSRPYINVPLYGVFRFSRGGRFRIRSTHGDCRGNHSYGKNDDGQGSVLTDCLFHSS